MRGLRRRPRMVNGSRELHEDGYSDCRRWRRVRPDCRPNGPCLWADTGAAARWCFRRYPFARGCAGRRSTPSRRFESASLLTGLAMSSLRQHPRARRISLGIRRIRPDNPGLTKKDGAVADVSRECTDDGIKLNLQDKKDYSANGRHCSCLGMDVSHPRMTGFQ